jgi:hypothetical protein
LRGGRFLSERGRGKCADSSRQHQAIIQHLSLLTGLALRRPVTGSLVAIGRPRQIRAGKCAVFGIQRGISATLFK